MNPLPGSLSVAATYPPGYDSSGRLASNLLSLPRLPASGGQSSKEE